MAKINIHLYKSPQLNLLIFTTKNIQYNFYINVTGPKLSLLKYVKNCPKIEQLLLLFIIIGIEMTPDNSMKNAVPSLVLVKSNTLKPNFSINNFLLLKE